MSKFLQSKRDSNTIFSASPPANYYHPRIQSTTTIYRFGKSQRFEHNQSIDNLPGPGSYFRYKPVLKPIESQVRKEEQPKCKYIPSIPSKMDQIYEIVGNGMLMCIQVPKQQHPRKNNHLEVSLKKPLKSSNTQSRSNSPELQQVGCLQGKSIIIQCPEIQAEYEKCNESTKMDQQASISICKNKPMQIIQNQDLVDLSIEKCLILQRLLKSNQTPGPGQYQLSNIKEKKISRRFNNITKLHHKFVKIDKIQYPGPGQYDPKLSQSNSAILKYTAPRKILIQNESNPGPGSYNLPMISKVNKISNIQFSSSFGSGQKRFQDCTHLQPGPGDYNIQLKKHVEKKRLVEVKLNKNDIQNDNKLIQLAKLQQQPIKESKQPNSFQQKSHPSAAFMSAERFKRRELGDQTYIGPGYYDIKSIRTKFNRGKDVLNRSYRKMLI